MKWIYRGERFLDGKVKVEVSLIGEDVVYDLPHIVRHSPDGFNWGYAGSGPAELARCILLDMLGEAPPWAELLYQRFKFAFIVGLGDKWEITSKEIIAWMNEQKADADNAGS